MRCPNSIAKLIRVSLCAWVRFDVVWGARAGSGIQDEANIERLPEVARAKV